MAKYIALYELGDEETSVGVVFPDLPGCISMGDNYDEAVQMAHEALSAHIEALLADGEPIPAPRTLEQIRAEWEDWKDWEREGNFIVGTVSVFPKLKPKKCTLYLDSDLLDRIDEVCKNRSAFISGAAQAALDNKLYKKLISAE